MTTPFNLHSEPDWHSAATQLVHGLVELPQAEARIQLLETVCEQLGNQLYPAFLQILQAINEFADLESKQIIASTLVSCLRSGRLPSGKLSAWGSSTLTGDSSFGQTRILGPIEYVCAWYSQGNASSPLTLQQFTSILTHLMELVATDDQAKQLYARKLISDADDPMSGTLSNQTRTALRDFTDLWVHSDSNNDAIDAFLTALQSDGLLQQLSQDTNNPFL
ncbi:MAG: hypothetical protein KTR35_16145 [Gammaproteobacteria bacterium]|nr:hypothetical protein [Gammaproteobacteria bacterium]